MKIYICHSTQFDYKTELYQPIKESALFKEHEFIFPHDTDKFVNSKDIVKSCDLVIAEVSYPSIGEGIELGWADDAQVPVVCIHHENCRISPSLSTITSRLIPYDSTNLTQILDNLL